MNLYLFFIRMFSISLIIISVSGSHCVISMESSLPIGFKKGFDAHNITLTKAFHHKGLLSSKVVLLFNKDPLCTFLPKNSKEFSSFSELESEFPSEDNQDALIKNLEFFMHKTSFRNDIKKNKKQGVFALNDDEKMYKVSCVETLNPLKGLCCSVQFSPKDYNFKLTQFRNITGELGIVFELLNKQVLETINHNSFPVRRYSYRQNKQPTIVLDCGHGGKDPGHVAGAIFEKDINLQIGLKVANLLKKKDILLS